MSKSFLVDYVNERLKEYAQGQAVQQKGVITISREYGCPGKIVSAKLAEALSSPQNSWKVIDKEILQIAAQELSIPEELAEKLFHSKPRTLMQ
ncbi:MAG: cytidylate kinase-like family protein, partial [Leptospiraceae bacterium]|nr:cytidylate kinase-like family protein [Leptospiraceae bacterium]